MAVLIALVVGAIVPWMLAWRLENTAFAALLGVAAAALVITSFNAFDPYYLPTRCGATQTAARTLADWAAPSARGRGR